jgi:hypothetical protein
MPLHHDGRAVRDQCVHHDGVVAADRQLPREFIEDHFRSTSHALWTVNPNGVIVQEPRSSSAFGSVHASRNLRTTDSGESLTRTPVPVTDRHHSGDTDCLFRARHVRPKAAQNDASARRRSQSRTGVLCVEDHERICADMCAVSRGPGRHSGTTLCAATANADRQICVCVKCRSGAPFARGRASPTGTSGTIIKWLGLRTSGWIARMSRVSTVMQERSWRS